MALKAGSKGLTGARASAAVKNKKRNNIIYRNFACIFDPEPKYGTLSLLCILS
jgi:hypothetical protein